MEIRKILLYVALAFVGMTLWTKWLHFKQPSTPTQSSRATELTQPSTAAPQAAPLTPSTPTTVQSVASHGKKIALSDSSRWVVVTTDLMQVSIDPSQGSIVSAKLLNYNKKLKDDSQKVTLLSPKDDQRSIIQMGFAGKNGQLLPPIALSAKKSRYELREGQDQLNVVLHGKSSSGLDLTRQITFKRGSYALLVRDTIKNVSKKTWVGNGYTQVSHLNLPQPKSMFYHTFSGASLSSHDHSYKKFDYKALSKNNIGQTIRDGWVALQQKYFLLAIVPQANVPYHFYSQMLPQGQVDYATLDLGVASPLMNLAPGQEGAQSLAIYVGPELGHQLDALAPHLSLTIDYGWFWWLSKPIFAVLKKINSVVGNWGVSIILVTMLIKLLLHPFTAMSFKSMARMRDLAPRLQTLKERYGDDKQKLSQATMEIYRKEKINPLGGCLPMLLQIPFFIALYWVLIESVQLRHAPFIFWIHDLSVKDPMFVLPVLMGVSMFVQQKLSPQPPDPTQAKMMMLLPVFLTVMFFNFPAGLVLYWLTNNIVTIIQQWWVNRQISKQK